MTWKLGDTIKVPVRAVYEQDRDATVLHAVLGGKLHESVIPKHNLVTLVDEKMVDWANEYVTNV